VFDILFCRAWTQDETLYSSGEKDVLHCLVVVSKLTQVNVGLHRLLIEFDLFTRNYEAKKETHPTTNAFKGVTNAEFLVEAQITLSHDKAKEVRPFLSPGPFV